METRFPISAHSGTAALRCVGLLALLSAGCAEELGPRLSADGGDAQADALSPDAATQHDGAAEASANAEPDLDANRDADAEASSDTATDAGDSTTPREPDGASSCEAVSAAIDRFVEAHRSCSVDADCAIVGDCGHADWRAVAAPYAEEANQMVRASPCIVVDGPGGNVVCRSGQCQVVRSALWCGPPPEVDCPQGSARSFKGCGTVAATYTDGCHAPCTPGAGANACAPGYSCQTTTVDPCRPSQSGEPTCAACGAEIGLCLPAPACALKLSVKFQGQRTTTTLRGNESTVLELWLENLTAGTLDLRFDSPCHGPVISGLGNYDVWNTCLSGVCESETVRTELTLTPREKMKWRSAVLAAGATDCNQDGLAAGIYTPSFSLGVSGVNGCGPEAAQLTVVR